MKFGGLSCRNCVNGWRSGYTSSRKSMIMMHVGKNIKALACYKLLRLCTCRPFISIQAYRIVIDPLHRSENNDIRYILARFG
jgi:hypothetical protein